MEDNYACYDCPPFQAIPMNLVSDCDGFAWKGHSELGLVSGKQNFPPGFQPSMILQISPPATITSLAANAKWGLVAVGTAHGFGLFDFVQKKVVMLRCTLNPNGELPPPIGAFVVLVSF